MILILLNWLVNGFLMSLIYVFGAIILYKGTIHPFAWLLFGYGTITLFMFIGLSKIGFYLLKIYLGCRFIARRERQRIDPLLLEVLSQINKTYGINYSIDKLHIMLVDSNIPDAQAFGKNAVILSQGLLKNISDDELKAILAHELGHIYYKDSVILMALIFGSLATRIIMCLYTIYLACRNGLNKVNKIGIKGLHIIPLLALIPLIIFLPVILFYWISTQLFNICLMVMNRRYTYKADKFAKELGYKDGLISYLETIQILSKEDNSFIGRIFAAHPPPMKRIGRLEENIAVKDCVNAEHLN